MMALSSVGTDVWLTSPRLRGEVGLPRRCEASSGAIRVRGTLNESELVESPPHHSRCFASAFFYRERRPKAAYALSPQAGRGRRSTLRTGDPRENRRPQ